jgi:xyloglucan-specific endo-beta-1,4-glucanase
MGANGNGQFVYSWLAPDNIAAFDEDISPLLHYLWRSNYIDEANYLGIVQFGTETFHSSANVTFSMQDFNMSVHPGEPQAPPPQPTASGTGIPKSKGSLHFSPNMTWVVIATIFSWVLSV